MNRKAKRKITRWIGAGMALAGCAFAAHLLLGPPLLGRTQELSRTQAVASHGSRAVIASQSKTIPSAMREKSVRKISARKISGSPNAAARAHIEARYAALPLMFEANQGQADPRVKFLSRGQGYTFFLTKSEAVLALAQTPTANLADARPGMRKPAVINSSSAPVSVLRLKFAGARDASAIVGRREMQGKTNYLIGNDPRQWHTNVANYAGVEYRGVYPGVDAVFHGGQQRLEFDFKVAPGADPKVIALEVKGVKHIRMNPNGDAALSLGHEKEVVLGKPRAYQEIAGRRREVAGSFVIGAGNRIGLAIGPYDHSQALVVDPTLTYSTYLGVTDLLSETGLTPVSVAVDNAGAAYVTGTTLASNFPIQPGPNAIPPAYQSTCPGFCTNPVAFVMKLDPSQSGANSLIYSTYLGPNDSLSGPSTQANAIAVDTSGNAYVAGQTNSANFPLRQALPVEFANSGGPIPEYFGFATELNSSGTDLVYSTYIGGGQGNNVATGIAVRDDTSGIHTYLTGYTTSQNLIPPSVPSNLPKFQGSLNGPQNAFVTEFHLNIVGSTFDYLTYLGGNGTDAANGIAVSPNGEAFVVGSTNSTTFPTQNPYQASLNPNPSQNAFFTAVAADGSSLIYSTYLGGTGADVANAVAASSDNKAYIAGNIGFPVPGFPVTQNTTCNSNSLPPTCPQMFVAEMDPSQSGTGSLVYSSYLGGTPPGPLDPGIESAQAIAVDAAGDAFVTGWEDSAKYVNFPLAGVTISSDAIQPTDPCLPMLSVSPKYQSYSDSCSAGFLVEFSPDASSIVYSTFLGIQARLVSGAPNNFPIVQGTSIALDSKGDAYIAGLAGGFTPLIPTGNNAFQQNPPDPFNGTFDRNAFLSVIGGLAGPPFAQYSNAGPIAFGPTNVGSIATLRLTLTNTGGSAFTVSAIGLQGANSGAFTVTNAVCNGTPDFPFSSTVTLELEGTCTITLQFAPTVAGSDAELLTITTSTTNSNAGPGGNGIGQAILLGGDGVAPFATFSASQLSFGNQNDNTSATQAVTVSNTGTGTLTLDLVNISSGKGFSFDDPGEPIVCGGVAEPSSIPWPLTVAPGGSCTFPVQFDPTVPGAVSGVLGFEDNAASGESNLTSTSIGTFFQQMVSLSGTGVPPVLPPPPPVSEPITVTDTVTFSDIVDTEPIIVTDTVPPPSAPFVKISPEGAVSVSGDYVVTLTLTNSGNVAADVLLSSAKLGAFTVSSFPKTPVSIPPNGSSTFAIPFSPRAGLSGSRVAFSVSGTYSGGTTLGGNWSVSLRSVTLP